MASHFEGQEVLEAAVAGIPAIAEHIAAMPDGQRAMALDALERHYLQTAQDWGCSQGPARTWASAMMCHIRARIEQPAEPLITGLAGDRPSEDYSLAEKILTRTTGALALLAASPLIAFVWAGLKLERPGPAIGMRTTGWESAEAYQFVLGWGWVSRFVRRADLEAIPMLWHLLNGDNVLRFQDFVEIVRSKGGEMLLSIPGKRAGSGPRKNLVVDPALDKIMLEAPPEVAKEEPRPQGIWHRG